jgi:F0F1-type ATP synthase membrane subunit c/vacuolar-type H+-ATPase subunit K
MITTPIALVHYGVISLISVLAGLGAGIGQGIAAIGAFKAVDRQPSVESEVNKSIILALAIIETAVVLGLIFIMILFFKNTTGFYQILSEVGIGCALGIPAFVIGVASGLPAYSAMMSIARQPFMARKMTNAMLLTQSIIQTPIIFGFLIATVINYQLTTAYSLNDALRLIASGLSVGLASVGSAIGLGYFAYVAAESLGKNSNQYSKILSFTFLSQAIIETPLIFSAIIGFWITQTYIAPTNDIVSGIACLASAIAVGIGTWGSSISSGKTAGSACRQIALHPSMYGKLSKSSVLFQGIIDTSAIFAFIISIILLLAKI